MIFAKFKTIKHIVNVHRLKVCFKKCVDIYGQNKLNYFKCQYFNLHTKIYK